MVPWLLIRLGNGGAAPPAVVAGTYSDPGFWTEEHRKIKEREEAPPPPPVTALSQIPEFIEPPKPVVVWTDDDEMSEILELMAFMDDDARLS